MENVVFKYEVKLAIVLICNGSSGQKMDLIDLVITKNLVTCFEFGLINI